jgi:hypothetical protein
MTATSGGLAIAGRIVPVPGLRDATKCHTHMLCR